MEACNTNNTNHRITAVVHLTRVLSTVYKRHLSQPNTTKKSCSRCMYDGPWVNYRQKKWISFSLDSIQSFYLLVSIHFLIYDTLINIFVCSCPQPSYFLTAVVLFCFKALSFSGVNLISHHIYQTTLRYQASKHETESCNDSPKWLTGTLIYVEINMRLQLNLGY